MEEAAGQHPCRLFCISIPQPRGGIRFSTSITTAKTNPLGGNPSHVYIPLFVIPAGNLRFARIIKATSGGEPL